MENPKGTSNNHCQNIICTCKSEPSQTDPLSCRLPGDLLVSLTVLRRRLLHNLLRHLHALLTLQSVARQPIAQELLIKAWLRLAQVLLPRLLGPEAAAVRSKHLINKHHLILLIKPKLKLGIRKHNTDRKSTRLNSSHMS